MQFDIILLHPLVSSCLGLTKGTTLVLINLCKNGLIPLQCTLTTLQKSYVWNTLVSNITLMKPRKWERSKLKIITLTRLHIYLSENTMMCLNNPLQHIPCASHPFPETFHHHDIQLLTMSNFTTKLWEQLRLQLEHVAPFLFCLETISEEPYPSS